MRNAFGLMCATVVFGRRDRRRVVLDLFAACGCGRPPQTVNAGKPSRFPSPPPSRPLPDVEVTAALSAPVAAKPVAAPVQAKCANADALGVSRVVDVDTTGGPGFGFQHFKQLDFLAEKEVVLTFDDGPWPTTPAVLKALAEECTKATFFPIGKHPPIIRKFSSRSSPPATPSARTPGRTRISTARS